MACMAVSSASATSLCAANEEECASPLGSGTAIELSVAPGTKALFQTSLATVECVKSKAIGKTTSGSGNTVSAVIESFSFEECKTSAGTNCTVKVTTLPYNTSISAVWGNNGELKVGGLQFPIFCLAVIECTFKVPSSAALSVTGGNPAVAKAEEIKLEAQLGGLLCPIQSNWQATYQVVKPKPLWITLWP